MPISNKDRAHRILLLSLLGANILLYAAWPWLSAMPLKADSSEPPALTNVLRHETYLASFFDAIRANKKILFLGCSESIVHYNMGAQLNELGLDDPQMVVLARGGMSPIHSALTIARAKREGVQIPPLVLVVNPVYFTRSHDVINDGWMSTMIPSPVFMQLNHRDVRHYLTEEVQESYDTHFGFRRALYPATIQEYVGNLIYLAFHQSPLETVEPVPLRASRYHFKGALPKYDERKNVWLDVQAVDRFEKTRWRVNEVAESVNLKGLASSMRILAEEPAPLLLLILPVNRRFYEYHQLNMEEFDSRYRDIRKVLHAMGQGQNVHLIDLFDVPRLHFGFRDRMHMDAYGFAQLAKYVYQSERYRHYLEAVKSYYDDQTPSSIQRAAHKEKAAPR
jgi:DltD protein